MLDEFQSVFLESVSSSSSAANVADKDFADISVGLRVGEEIDRGAEKFWRGWGTSVGEFGPDSGEGVGGMMHDVGWLVGWIEFVVYHL